MSLSENTPQSRSESGTCKAFRMESFDTTGPSSGSETVDHTFEALFNDDDSQDGVFGEYMSSGSKEVVEAAKKQASLIERDAYEKGFAQGEKDGMEMGTKRLDKILDQIHETLQEIVSYKQEFIKLHEKEMLGLICRIAEKVVREKVKVDHNIVREAIFEAFNLTTDRTEITVKVGPEDIEYVKELRPEFFDRIKDLKSITIESDPSISQGGCFMETAFGHVDARLESQLDKIATAVERAFEENHPGDLPEPLSQSTAETS